MSEGVRTDGLFGRYHPIVGFSYLVIAIVFSIAAFQPVYVALSFAGSLTASVAVRGVRRTARILAWAVPFGVVIAVFNMLFTSAGSTVLFTAFDRVFYLESLAYGATAGGAFAAMMLWFAVYADVMDSEATAAVMGRVLPLVSLMVSQVMRLVPQFVRRGRAVRAVQGATTAATMRTRREQLGWNLRALSVLMSWGMEDGIVRADAMRARGYGCRERRTRYRRQRFAVRDAVVLGILFALAAGNAFLAWVACSQFGFYPHMDTLVAWWGYACYALFVAIPLILTAREALLWR